MKLIVGLGNPGEKYAANRHNIGFLAVDEIARTYKFGPWKHRFHGSAAEGLISGEKSILLKPSTFMNESGRAVGEASRFYKLGLDDVIVIHDELDLEPGKVRVKAGGGNAGHLGLKSISAHIGNDYRRVRLGIGHPGDKALVTRYVLQDFPKADRAWLSPLLAAIARGAARLVEGNDSAFLNEAARGRAAPAAQKERTGGEQPAEARRAPAPAAAKEALAVKLPPPKPRGSFRSWLISRFRGSPA
jgi:PTH1 family peptidyl-tRNA hydrolase